MTEIWRAMGRLGQWQTSLRLLPSAVQRWMWARAAGSVRLRVRATTSSARLSCRSPYRLSWRLVVFANPADVQDSRGHELGMLRQGALVALQLRAEGDDGIRLARGLVAGHGISLRLASKEADPSVALSTARPRGVAPLSVSSERRHRRSIPEIRLPASPSWHRSRAQPGVPAVRLAVRCPEPPPEP